MYVEVAWDGRDHTRVPSMDRRIILKWILHKRGVRIWTAFI
jgi:hypothetical protein